MAGMGDWTGRLLLGAAAGAVGTVVIQALQGVQMATAPETMPPIRQHPGEFMVEAAEKPIPRDWRRAIPESAEFAAAQGLGLGYGTTFGALYGAVRPEGGPVLSDGAALGAACWAAGYLGWLPALGLMPPVTEQEPAQVVAPLVEHVAYGIATVAAFRWLRSRTRPRAQSARVWPREMQRAAHAGAHA